MATTFEEINNLEIIAVLDAAGISYKKDSGSPYMYTIYKPNGELDTSFKVNSTKNIACDFGGSGVKGGPFDIIGRYLLSQDTQSNVGKVETIKWFVEKGLVKSEEFKKIMVKHVPKEELVKRFADFKLGGYKDEVGRWLKTRGFTHDFITKNNLLVAETFKDIGFYEHYYCTEYQSNEEDGQWINREGDEPKNVPVIIFPCYDENSKVVGVKLRRVDGKTIRGQKSYAVGNTGLLWWGNISDLKSCMVVEGEPDGVVLRLLGYKGVLVNMGGCQAHKEKIKSLLYENSKVLCLYDEDEAGELAKLSLSEVMGRTMYQVDMPIRQGPKGEKISDVNDLFRVGYDTKAKWDKIFADMYEIGSVNDGTKLSLQRYAFLSKFLDFYDTDYDRVQDAGKIAASMGYSGKELHKLVLDGIIPKYIDVCYKYKGQENYYNLLDDTNIVLHGGKQPAIIHPHIELLMSNICGHKKKNIHWMHEAILYKLTHLNDVNVPAVVLYGSGGSGKGTFINLLSKIFGHENTQVGLGQKELEGSFDAFAGNKLIVEFKEVSSGNTFQDKRTLDRIKSMVCEPRITVRRMYRDAEEIENIAWFHMSSNHSLPIQLDSGQSGNRRFTIIKTGNMLATDTAVEMNTVTFKNKDIIQQYVAWLYENYPEVPNWKSISALSNDEKKMLEERCEGVGNQVMEWIEERFPNVWKISSVQMKVLVEMYRLSEGIEFSDKRYTLKNMDNSLAGKYEKKAVSIAGKTYRGYGIEKTPADMLNAPEGGKGWFEKDEWDRVLRQRDTGNFNNF